MSYKFRIDGAWHGKQCCFPGLNDILAEATRNPMCYNRMKRKFENIAITCIRRDLRDKKFDTPVELNYTFGEVTRRRDLDNVVAGARKIINDSLVKNHTLKDDSPRYIPTYGKNNFVYVSKPFIEVEIKEIGWDTFPKK